VITIKYLILCCFMVLNLSCSVAREIKVHDSKTGESIVVGKLGPQNVKGGVLFRVNAPAGTRNISVAGSFNDWNPEEFFLSKNRKLGIWEGFRVISPGKISFKYIRNGFQWLNDPFVKKVADSFGGYNSVFIVKKEK